MSPCRARRDQPRDHRHVLEIASFREWRPLPGTTGGDLRPRMQLARLQQAAHQRIAVDGRPRDSAGMRTPSRFAEQPMPPAAPLVQHTEVAQHQVGRVGLDDRAQPGDRARQQFVVGIEEPDVTSARRRQQAVARRRQAAVAFVGERADDAGMPHLQLRRDLPAAIRRGVVEQHDLDAVDALREDRGHAGLEIAFDAVHRHQHAQPRHFSGCRHGWRPP